MTYPFSVIDGSNNAPLMVHFTVNPDTPIGTDVWEFGEIAHNGVWTRPSRTLDSDGPVPTPGKRYPYVGSGRDVLYVIGASPAVSKTVDRSSLKPGSAATYTLTYSANGSGALPPTIDDYRLVDVLPLGMHFVTGSASEEPTSVTIDGSGREVLTWVLDDVPTNQANTLTYQACRRVGHAGAGVDQHRDLIGRRAGQPPREGSGDGVDQRVHADLEDGGHAVHPEPHR